MEHDLLNSTLVVDLKVPLETEHLVGAPALTFSRWLPIGRDKGICITEDGVELLLWFELRSTWWASQPTEEELSRHTNVLAHYVRAEVVMRDIAPALSAYIQARDFTRLPSDSEKSLQQEYERLGALILRILLTRVNRLISFARATKGQYWLVEYEIESGRMHGYFQAFEAKGRMGAGPPFRFQPAVGAVIQVTTPDSARYISEEEWPAVQAFVRSERRAPLVAELLAGAERLAGNGYARSALTEAVTALEVAIAEFGRAANGGLASLAGPRIGVTRLARQFEHLGLTGTVSYLLPLLLPEATLSTEVLVGCREALEARHNVVHNGQREVPNLHKHLSSIRACCKVLDSFIGTTAIYE